MRAAHAAILLVLVTAGCVHTEPARNYAAYSDQFAAVVQGLNSLRQNDRIDDATYREITPVIRAADAAFDSWAEALMEAEANATEVNVPRAVIDMILDALDKLVVWQAKLKRR